MLEPYEHPEFEISGTWDTRSCNFNLCFPVIGLNKAHEQILGSKQQFTELLEQISRIVIGPHVELVSFRELPTTDASPPLIPIEESWCSTLPLERKVAAL
jgi:hypothetical protein